MLVHPSQATDSLYHSDYYLWLKKTLNQLKNQDFKSLDLENLVQEMTDLSRRQKRKLKNLLRQLLEHILKLQYWKTEQMRNRRHWQAEITNFRKQIKDQLNDSPSLRPYLYEIFDECYRDACEILAFRSGLDLTIFAVMTATNLDQILDQTWFP